ncbi:MAG: hypothetical protein JW738_01990 [Actinobacteria bacterium]|nr:hypothetical protein [Actinomycetota bacterium]
MLDNESIRKLNERLTDAFYEAYPDVPDKNVEHMVRNFIQVVNGIMEVGDKVQGDEELVHMDVANSLVYWCVTNTSLEEFIESGSGEGDRGEPRTCLNKEETEHLVKEFAARTADWLIGLEVLREDPVLFKRFVKGALAFGAAGWERNRGLLGY